MDQMITGDSLLSEVENLKTALATRGEISKALGVIIAFHRVDEQTAWRALSSVSQRHNIKVARLAPAIVQLASGAEPNDVDAASVAEHLLVGQRDGRVPRPSRMLDRHLLAETRDRLAEERDRAAERRDVDAEVDDRAGDMSPEHAASDRRSASQDRRAAAANRRSSAADRRAEAEEHDPEP